MYNWPLHFSMVETGIAHFILCIHTSSDFNPQQLRFLVLYWTNTENKTWDNKDKTLISFDIWGVFISQLLTMLCTSICIITTPWSFLHSVLSIGSSSINFFVAFSEEASCLEFTRVMCLTCQCLDGRKGFLM